jgi:hypothetical protein
MHVKNACLVRAQEAFSGTIQNDVQELAARLVFPRGSGRKFRDPVKYIDGYTMEELARSLFTGCIFAFLGPAGLQRLWRPLSKAGRHYIHGHDAGEPEMRAAAQAFSEFAAELEKLVIAKQVCLAGN